MYPLVRAPSLDDTMSQNELTTILIRLISDQFINSYSGQHQSEEFIPELNQIKIESEPDLSYLTTHSIPDRSRITIDQDELSSKDLSGMRSIQLSFRYPLIIRKLQLARANPIKKLA